MASTPELAISTLALGLPDSEPRASIWNQTLIIDVHAIRELLSYRLDHIEALLVVHSAEHHVLVVQPLGLDGGDEELRPVGVGAGVGHTQQTRAPVLHQEVLILKLWSVNALAACPVKILKISTLQIQFSHKIHTFTNEI